MPLLSYKITESFSNILDADSNYIWEVLPIILHSSECADFTVRWDVLSGCAQPRAGNSLSGSPPVPRYLRLSYCFLILRVKISFFMWYIPSSDTAVMNTKGMHYGKKYICEWNSSCCQTIYLCLGFAATWGKQCRRSRYVMKSRRLCKSDAVKLDTKQSITLTLFQIDY